MDQLHALKDRTKEKAKHLLDQVTKHDVNSVDGDVEASDDGDDIFTDAAFNPYRVLDENPPNSLTKDASVSDKVSEKLKALGHFAASPRRAVRNIATQKAAKKIGTGKKPVINVAGDQKFVEAYDALEQAKTSSLLLNGDGEGGLSEDDILANAKLRLRELEEQRDSLQTAWILGRHVTRVKAVEYPSKPNKEDFWQLTGDETRTKRFEWERYLARLLLYHTRGFTAQYVDDFSREPFDLQDLARIVERLAITSSPWQSFALDLRRVYRWDDPWRTARWATLFWVLWYFQYIGSYIYGWIIYATLRNRFRASTVAQVREGVTRSLDREAKAEAWGELIQRHGNQDWIEPLLDEIGPLIQMQLGDLADYLEVLLNFYRHERPAKTAGSLFFLSTCLLTTLITDMACCIKLGWCVVGFWYFFQFPLSARFPQYRFLCSWPRWIFWDVPTHSELAIIRLQEKAALADADFVDDDNDSNTSSSDETNDENYHSCQESIRRRSPRAAKSYSFRVFHREHLQARLILSRDGVKLRTKTNVIDFYSYQNIEEIRKVDVDSKLEKAAALKHKPEGLQLICTNKTLPRDLTFVVRRSDRDKIFNLILAWSGRKWQALQMNRHHSVADDRSRFEKTLKRAVG